MNQPIADRRAYGLLLLSVFATAICGLLYELLIGAISSYYLGGSVTHFSITIGLFMSAMGLGSYLSRYVENDLLEKFIYFEVLLGVAGGLSAPALTAAYSFRLSYYTVLIVFVMIIGALVGLEIPLLTRIIRKYDNFKTSISQALTYDYIGSLIGSLIFPLILLPKLGVMRTAFLIGSFNIIIGLVTAYYFRFQLPRTIRYFTLGILGLGLLVVGLAYSTRITGFFESYVYQDKIIYAEQSPYQRLILTKWDKDIRLYINNNLQFASVDEYRYHEPLIHIPMLLSAKRNRVLVLGGGDGLALREIWKYADVDSVDLVDLDPAMTNLGRDNFYLTELNKNSMKDKRLTVYNMDAYQFIEQTQNIYDCIIIDLPDPNDTGLGKLYSVEFYAFIKKRLSAGGVVVTQSTSPYYAPAAFWCIRNTLSEVFPQTLSYQNNVPTFGVWGFNLAIQIPPNASQMADSLFILNAEQRIRSQFLKQKFKLRYLNSNTLSTLFVFDPDMARRPTEINRLDNQVLIRYYDKGWQKWL